MQENTATVPAIFSPDQQLKQFSKQVESLRQVLHANQQGCPQQVLDGLSLLANNADRLSQQVARHEEERKNLRALADIGQIVNSSLELNEVLRIVMDTIIRLTRAERGFLMLREQGENLAIRIARNWERESLEPSEFEISRTVINRVASEGKPIVTTNAQEDPRFGGQESIIAYNLRSILCVPLKVKEEITGVIYADNRIRAGIFTEAERDLLAAFANHAAVAIENARLFESVRRTLVEVIELKSLMDNIFASIASGVITADIEDQILLCNRAAESILGKSADDIIGQALVDCMSPLGEQLCNSVAQIRQTDQAILGLEINANLPERGPVDLRFNLSPLKDAQQNTQGVAIVLDDLTERKRLEAQRRLFERMVSPAVIQQLDPDKIHLGGQRQFITVLFADVRGFTRFSENLAPEQLVTVLNYYLAAAAEAILAQEGTVDKFMGDGVMAWFNAPIPQPDHPLRAVRAALGMRAAVEALHQNLPPEFRLGFGTGIHYGPAVLGLVGSERRVDYTAIGDSVNTAKRIQENATQGQILISAETYRSVTEEIIVRKVEPVSAKGKSQPVEVFEVMGLK